MRNGVQTQFLKSLYLDTVMHNVAKAVDLTTALKRTLSLANSSYNAKAETRIIINLYTHCSYL